ncbi:MAG TPA: MTH938/NDUFAF3 family protein [Gallionellaceae bacterium]
MKPKIDGAEFGSLTIDGEAIGHDVLIRLSGKIKKRKKKLSRAVYGTSHTLSRDEARHIFEKGAQRLIIGSGHEGNVRLSDEAAEYFAKKKVRIDLLPTPEAIAHWNKARGAVIGLFHVTC